jgi:hypothetical protein
MRRSFIVVVACLAFTAILDAQSTDASLAGRIADPSNAMIVGATVSAINVDKNFRYQTTTNSYGEYYLPNLPPGSYRLEIEKSGFKKLIKPDVVLHVQDRVEINLSMTLGATTQSITVEAGVPLLNTQDASVSTLIGNRFVENMPLNGRSFSSLLDLTPGVVLTPANQYEGGQYSVNGQRPDANYFMVDGVSVNLGSRASNYSQAGAGQLPATSAFGGMSNLVSLDGLEEFRVQTSTLAPEYGRQPGAQVSVVTKSGTNAFHGIAFEYFRNEILDANDWFANNNGAERAALRQNDFGGVFGGAILRNRLFFFGSYEGARVRQPQFALACVPSLATLAQVESGPHPEVFPLLNAFPKPTPGAVHPDCSSLPGRDPLAAGYSDPSSLNASSLRLDYLPVQRVTVFARYVDSPSSLAQRAFGVEQRAYSEISHTKDRFQSLTAGSNQTITPRLTNELRFNYSKSHADLFTTLDNFAGAVPPPDSLLFPAAGTAHNGLFGFFADVFPFIPYGLNYDVGKNATDIQHQINVTDNISHVVRDHQLKFGVDYRRLRPEVQAMTYLLEYEYLGLGAVARNSALGAFVVSRNGDTQLIFTNWSLFAQDTWNTSHNLTLTYGLRWEYNAAPTSPNGTLPFTMFGLNDLSTATLAPPGTPLWHPKKHDFAPRLGIAWHPRPSLVVKAGGGIFYDLGYSGVANGSSAFPYAQENLILFTFFPLSATAAAPPPFTTEPPANFLAVVDPHHLLPRTYEWNAAVEQTFGTSDVVSLTYLGAGGRKLMRNEVYFGPNPSQVTGEFDYMHNGATSSYNALQAQFRHRFSHRLQSLLSYTWAHAIDDVSSDIFFAHTPPSIPSNERGSSDYDIKHTFAGAISYDLPSVGNGIVRSIIGHWSTDSIIYARSAPTVNVVTGLDPFNLGFEPAHSVQRPDVVPGQPFYLHESGAPGGKVINPLAFSIPNGKTQGDLGRNALRGFGATQFDLALRRQFRFTENVSMQARADFFNLVNHPNFGPPINYLSNTAQFGMATQMLSNSLGGGGISGGVNPLYQVGGPRSIQLALKLLF